MHWRLIIEEFGPTLQHIPEVENIVAYTLGIFPSTKVNRDEPSTSIYLSRSKGLFERRAKKTLILYPPYILL